MNSEIPYSKEEATEFFYIVKGKHIVLVRDGVGWHGNKVFVAEHMVNDTLMSGKWITADDPDAFAFESTFSVFRGFQIHNEADYMGMGYTTWQWKWADGSSIKTKKCECGSEKCGLPTHSSWCPKCKE